MYITESMGKSWSFERLIKRPSEGNNITLHVMGARSSSMGCTVDQDVDTDLYAAEECVHGTREYKDCKLSTAIQFTCDQATRISITHKAYAINCCISDSILPYQIRQGSLFSDVHTLDDAIIHVCESNQNTFNPVNLWHYITKPTTNCNRRLFNGFVIRRLSIITY